MDNKDLLLKDVLPSNPFSDMGLVSAIELEVSFVVNVSSFPVDLYDFNELFLPLKSYFEEQGFMGFRVLKFSLCYG